MIAFIVLYWKYIVIGLLSIALAGMTALYYVTDAKLDAASIEKTACQKANASNQVAIEKLKKLQSDCMETSDKRIDKKNKDISEIVRIQNLKGGEANAEKPSADSGAADDILDSLNGMFGKAGRKN